MIKTNSLHYFHLYSYTRIDRTAYLQHQSPLKPLIQTKMISTFLQGPVKYIWHGLITPLGSQLLAMLQKFRQLPIVCGMGTSSEQQNLRYLDFVWVPKFKCRWPMHTMGERYNHIMFFTWTVYACDDGDKNNLINNDS